MKGYLNQLICITKPVVLNATDLVGKNPTIVTLDFFDYDIIKRGEWSLGSGHEKVLAHGYDGYPRFDFMLGPMFIQVSVSDFGDHNKSSADIRKAFDDRESHGTNQIERYLNGLIGPSNAAKIENKRFVVTRNGAPMPGFRIVYLRGSPGNPSHHNLVKKFSDVRHVTFEELRENLFKNVIS